jgi:hypothetical protein
MKEALLQIFSQLGQTRTLPREVLQDIDADLEDATWAYFPKTAREVFLWVTGPHGASHALVQDSFSILLSSHLICCARRVIIAGLEPANFKNNTKKSKNASLFNDFIGYYDLFLMIL